MPRARRPVPYRSVVSLLLSAAVLSVGVLPVAGASGLSPPFGRPTPSYGNVSLALDRQFLGNLTVAPIAPGRSATLHYSLADPRKMAASLSHVRLEFQVYAFNGYPGDATARLPVSDAPVLSNASASGESVNVTYATLAIGAPVAGSVGVATAAATPAGTFAIRSALSFSIGATDYLLESRGWFSAATWASATELPNGSATLNLSVLHVSGVLPETAVLVVASDWAWALAALLAGAFVLLAAGAWVYSRRGPGSRSGTG